MGDRLYLCLLFDPCGIVLGARRNALEMFSQYPSLWSICGSRVSFIFLCTYWCLFNFLRGWNVIGISILLATLSAFRNEIRYSVIGVPVWKILRDFVKGSKREMSFFFVIERFTFTIKISFAISFIKMNIILAEMKRPLDSWN